MYSLSSVKHGAAEMTATIIMIIRFNLVSAVLCPGMTAGSWKSAAG